MISQFRTILSEYRSYFWFSVLVKANLSVRKVYCRLGLEKNYYETISKRVAKLCHVDLNVRQEGFTE